MSSNARVCERHFFLLVGGPRRDPYEGSEHDGYLQGVMSDMVGNNV